MNPMKKILVVDDEPHIQKLIALRLKVNRFQVFTAGNGVEGLEIAKREKPDLILLDIMMPKMNGYEFLQKLKTMPSVRIIPIIMFTAKASQEDVDRAIALGAIDYVIKPFDADRLLSKIYSVLGNDEDEDS